MTNKAIEQSEKYNWYQITFMYGDDMNPLFKRYTNWAQLVPGPGQGFVSVPTITVNFPDNTGTLERKPCNITMPNVDEFIEEASCGTPMSPIYVVVEEIIRGTVAGQTASTLTHFVGRCIQTTKNVNKRPGMVRFKCVSLKGRLDLSMGAPATAHCIFTLFGAGCGLLQSVRERAITITSLSGFEATILTPTFTSPASPGGDISRFWERGYLKLDGRRIGIKKWLASDPTRVILRRRPPASWVGPTVTAIPGCHKTLADCRDVWDNEAQFGGIGHAIPDYHPLYESPVGSSLGACPYTGDGTDRVRCPIT